MKDSKNEAKLRICIHRDHTYDNKTINVKLVIISENSVHKNIDKALKNKDIDPITEKIEEIISKSNQILLSQNEESLIEDEFSTNQIELINNFVLYAGIQVGVVLLIGVFHIFSFRRFLVKHDML